MSVLAREGHAGDATEHELFLFPSLLDPVPIAFLYLLRIIQTGSEARAGQQRHARKGNTLKRRLVLGVSHQEGSTHSRIVQERGPDGRRDFLEKDDIRRLFQSVEDMVVDEFGT